MKVIVENSAENCIDNIFFYNMQFSLKNAIETDIEITKHIYSISNTPYIGRYIPEISNKNFREIIYKKSKHSGYRIMYYLSENTNTIYVFHVTNCKQDFKNILNLHNYFKNYFSL